ncbi:hypothetical protein D0T53_01440 [Dysgonomonas sp. 216]|uniref:hypothetical protein n=1 Tax=Dysgonomonas sp. 216 TaxID=2302934 RepID=UPI0013D41129|nr:hypothetical protein [Dysgonomonas sp. 216]NDW17578.1 hypothetical protein [Dysgonomonas sp. 216]
MSKNIEDLRHIRSMMERSSKFTSLSGFSVIVAGVFALLGALLAYYVLYSDFSITGNVVQDLLIDAVLVIALAGASGVFFSVRKARKNSIRFWLPATRQIIIDSTIPMIAGGLFCFVLIYNHYTHMVAATMLVFYGLALINAGSRTYSETKVLGICEIILGFLAGIFIYNGLLFWSIGFGVLHIIYGVVMYFKHDRVSNKTVAL